MTTLRLLRDPPQPGPINMAADEALLNRVGRGDSPPTLRLYQWSPPTISLGYFQAYADYEALEPPAGELEVVRRLTGGGAILHDRELTYSLTLPLDHLLLAEGPNRLYELIHDAIIACLNEAGMRVSRGGPSDDSGPGRGPFFCFARRHHLDVLAGDEKLAGSAQRRTRQAVLQHGSIVIERRFHQQPAATTADVEPDPNQFADRFLGCLAAGAGIQTEPGQWIPDERQETERLVAKYAGTEWTRRT
ncbi:MAG: lipoate--protein ligase family protein [bacterium]|nr:lipoate--protein ligase family protein [bacterium]